MKSSERDGSAVPTTASGPLSPSPKKAPPRKSAPGPGPLVLAPARHMISSLMPPQPGQCVESGTQSATHSNTLPTMSNAPRADTQLLREPERVVVALLKMLQVVVSSSITASGVPFAPTCHSALVGSRLPALAQAAVAWNHVMEAEGRTDGRLTA